MPRPQPATPNPPAIETERLTLRGHRLEDFAESAAMWADPEVTRYISGRPFSAEEIWARLLRYVGHWSRQTCARSGSRKNVDTPSAIARSTRVIPP